MGYVFDKFTSTSPFPRNDVNDGLASVYSALESGPGNATTEHYQSAQAGLPDGPAFTFINIVDY